MNGGSGRDLAVPDVVAGIPMMPIEDLKRLTAYVAKVKKTLMTAGKDYVIDGKRQYTARSGFAKLAQGFRLSDEPPVIKTLYYDEPRTFEFDHKIRREWKHEVVETKIRGFEAIVRVIQLETGRFASGEGACTVEELSMTYNMSPKWYHRCLGTAKTRAWNRAVSNFVGSADVSAEEMGLVYDDEPPSRERKKVESEVAKVGPPPKPTATTLDEPEPSLPRGVASVEELHGLLEGKFMGAGEMFAVVESADGFTVEPAAVLDIDVVEEVTRMAKLMGGEYRTVGTRAGYDWFVPRREDESES